ncbi:unnamed protein product [Pleuronectes platessa]|uniref:Uncharacterized protein n=1 Tax=Pleuronectes platessa TaxID=8262 RepID=A0A9N7Y9Y1_PLEPL|nr:unnamed protein product [Pleuronectes platessa]
MVTEHCDGVDRSIGCGPERFQLTSSPLSDSIAPKLPVCASRAGGIIALTNRKKKRSTPRCPLFHPLPLLPPATHYLCPALLSAANFPARMETWARWLPTTRHNTRLQAHAEVSQTSSPRACSLYQR